MVNATGFDVGLHFCRSYNRGRYTIELARSHLIRVKPADRERGLDPLRGPSARHTNLRA